MNLLEDKENELWYSKNVIYCYTNKVNNKKYVGQTTNALYLRHRQHINDTNNINRKGFNYPLHKAIRKYGIENFTFEILHFADEYSIDLLEIHYIECLNLTNNKFGYNCKNGGSNGNPLFGKSTEEIDNIYSNIERRKKLSEVNKGKQLSNEHKQRISETLVGRTLSEEHKRKISEANKGKTFTNEHKNRISKNHADFKRKNHPKSKKVVQFDSYMRIVKIWDCITDASEELNIYTTQISGVCNGKRKSAGKDVNGNKIYWKYLSDVENDLIENYYKEDK